MDPKDRRLLADARAGDEQAIDRLLARHQKQVYRFGLRMCGSEEAAKEVLQQTLLTAFQDLHAFRGEASLSTWLYQVARSHCLKARRRRVDEPKELLPLETPGVGAVPSEMPDAEARAHAREVGEALQAAILTLPDTQREVLLLRDVEGLSAEETAHVLGLEVPAVKSRLHRARLDLRQRLTALLEPGRASGTVCPELVQTLAATPASDIDQATCADIEGHLARCPGCSEACEDLKRTVSLCSRIPGDEVPRLIRSAVKQALVQRSRGAGETP